MIRFIFCLLVMSSMAFATQIKMGGRKDPEFLKKRREIMSFGRECIKASKDESAKIVCRKQVREKMTALRKAQADKRAPSSTLNKKFNPSLLKPPSLQRKSS